MSSPIQSVTVVGDGAMGTLCALMLAEKGCHARLWGVSPDHVETLRTDRENRRYLSGRPFLPTITPVHDLDDVFDEPDLIVSAVPCQFMRSVWQRLAPVTPSGVPIVSVAKGIEVGTLRLPTEIITDCVRATATACLSGPNIAPEIAEKKPAGAVVASDDTAVARAAQACFSSDYYRVYAGNDRLGVEIAGATKNVIAVAAGICDGIEAGDNAKAALVARGLVEITRLGVAMGAREETFYGLAGVGDLVTTCISKVGRNRSAGERIGRGESAADVITQTSSVIEGIPTTRSVLKLAQRHEVEMPIVEGVAAVLFEGRDPRDAIRDLMTRPLAHER